MTCCSQSFYYYAPTVNEPAAEPIPAELVIVELVLVPLSLTVPPFKAIAFAPTVNTSFAAVVVAPPPIVKLKVNSLVFDPEAYDKT